MSFFLEVFAHLNLTDIFILFISGIFAALINAFAGGGTMVVFPLLLSMNIPPISANATSKLSLIFGNISAAYGFRQYRKEVRSLLPVLAIISILFGTLGGYLTILIGNKNFQFFIPWLILFATLVTLYGPKIQMILQNSAKYDKKSSLRLKLFSYALQVLSALYGGFFGAGVGIFLIGALNLIGIKSIHAINYVKHIMSILMSGAAIIIYIIVGAVNWPLTLILIVGAICGGIIGGKIGKKIKPKSLRAVIITVGFVLTAIYFNKYWFV